ncbi:amphiphysin isoform X2 [Boleophthalmus pectinirostris]|nr:amphiphysin isoform X2 [Boleophthalmus pectinirostris]
MKNYMAAIKGMQQASINLTQSLHEVYEPDWHGKDDVVLIGKDCDALWEDFHNKIVDSTLLNLDAYLTQFPDLKMRVAKRSRKLIDYDSARHHVETLQAQGLKNDRKMMKADEELKKAQRVFEDLNVGLQDELPTLWDSRVQFYIDTFKSVTTLEAKFHREISVVCRQLYEVMTKLAEQHPDKMFNIQGAPSDSGPLRLARTPSPPEDDSPPESPEPQNHLRPVSPGPPRPKSPVQVRKGPPVPPPPKVSPPKEETIIDLFGGEFLPAPSPSHPNERPGESLLDLDLDAFQVDESVAPIPQTTVPWDMWTADSHQDQAANGFNGFSTEGGAPAFFADFDKMNQSEAPPTSQSVEWAGSTPGEEPKAEEQPMEEPPSTDSSPAQVQEEPEKPEEPEPDSEQAVEERGAEERGAEEGGAEEGGTEEGGAEEGGTEEGGTEEGGTEEEGTEEGGADERGADERGTDEEAEVQKKESPVEEPEKMAIPSVVIEPASSNEGDDDRDGDIISPTVAAGNSSPTVAVGNSPAPKVQHIGPSDGTLPHDFLYKVETMHDFEAANSDELELSRGDVVLVVPTVNQEDQEAGWLTGIKLSDWSSLGVSAQRGLFPENFVQRLN